MGKYILKRLGYMLIVLLILSFLMFLLYNAAAGDRAYVKAYGEVKELKNITAEQRNAIFEETYLKYKRAYGTDNPSKIVQYLRWMGFYPYYDGQFNGLVQGNFGYSEYYRDDVLNVVKAPMKNTIFINIFATILALAITIPLGIHCAVRRGKTGDKIIQIRHFERCGDFFVRRIFLAQRNIVANGALKQEIVLKDDGNFVTQGFHRQAADILPVDFDRAGLYVVETGQQVNQRSFAAAGIADQSQRRAGFDVQTDIAQHRYVFLIF